MSDYAFVVDSNKALADLFWENLKDDPVVKGIISSKTQISFASPKDVQPSKKLSVFLYGINLQANTKNGPPNADSSGNRVAKASFALRYLIVPYTGDEEKDHTLLGKIIQTILANPVIAGEEPDTGYKLMMDSLGLDDMCRFWRAVDSSFRLSVGISVLPAELEGQVQVELENTVVAPIGSKTGNSTWELYEAVLKTFNEQIGSWKKRNLVARQWLMQDFKKNTEMSPDEVLSALNILGNKLELNLSAANSVEPLEALAKYYEHQRTEIQGLTKISQKQKENVEKIAQWIAEVKALIEAIS